MLYVRGNPADYDGWAQMGCRGWSYDEVLPFFRKSETYRGDGDPEYRSQGGPLIVEDYRTILPLTHALRRGGARRPAFPVTPDYNGKTAGGRRLFADDPARAAARLDRPHLPGRGEGPRQPARSRPTRSPPASCSTASAASASRFARTASTARSCARRARSSSRGGAVNSPHLLQISGDRPGQPPAGDRGAGGARFARRRRQPQRPLRRARLAPGNRTR